METQLTQNIHAAARLLEQTPGAKFYNINITNEKIRLQGFMRHCIQHLNTAGITTWHMSPASPPNEGWLEHTQTLENGVIIDITLT